MSRPGRLSCLLACRNLIATWEPGVSLPAVSRGREPGGAVGGLGAWPRAGRVRVTEAARRPVPVCPVPLVEPAAAT